MYDQLVNIVLLGDSGVGKTSLISSWINNTFSSILDLTVGVDFRSKMVLVNGNIIKSQIWDLGGSKRFRNIVTSYYKTGDCLLFVFSIDDRLSFDNLQNWISKVDYKLLKYSTVVGQKKDLDVHRSVSYIEGEEWAKKYNMNYVETSAKDVVEVKKLFEDIIKKYVIDHPSITTPSYKYPTQITCWTSLVNYIKEIIGLNN